MRQKVHEIKSVRIHFNYY